MIRRIKQTANKKGLSELVSYVLLIVIALGLAAGVYTWMKSNVPSETESCDENTAIIVRDYCLDAVAKTISITFENKGYFDIKGVAMKASKDVSQMPTIALQSTDEINSGSTTGRYDFSEALIPQAITTVLFSYTNLITSILAKIRVQPFINGKEGPIYCDNYYDVTIDQNKACLV